MSATQGNKECPECPRYPTEVPSDRIAHALQCSLQICPTLDSHSIAECLDIPLPLPCLHWHFPISAPRPPHSSHSDRVLLIEHESGQPSSVCIATKKRRRRAIPPPENYVSVYPMLTKCKEHILSFEFKGFHPTTQFCVAFQSERREGVNRLPEAYISHARAAALKGLNNQIFCIFKYWRLCVFRAHITAKTKAQRQLT